MSSAKWRQFCLGLNVLIQYTSDNTRNLVAKQSSQTSSRKLVKMSRNVAIPTVQPETKNRVAHMQFIIALGNWAHGVKTPIIDPSLNSTVGHSISKRYMHKWSSCHSNLVVLFCPNRPIRRNWAWKRSCPRQSVGFPGASGTLVPSFVIEYQLAWHGLCRWIFKGEIERDCLCVVHLIN